MATFLHNGPCPKCGSRDNLATYDDGSAWCWGCHYYVRSKLSGFVVKRQQKETNDDDEEYVKLPEGLSTTFPPHIVAFVQQYGLSVEELIKNGYRYLRDGEILSRAYGRDDRRDGSTQATGYETRSFEARRIVRKRHKQFHGSKENSDTYCRAESPSTTGVVIVEDALSSLKIAHVADSLALLGTSIPMSKVTALAQKYQRAWVWLDSDKFKEAWEIATKLKWLGVHTSVILTPKDPKWYTDEEIMTYLKETP